jgi:enoyl-CoA hydratase/carnithine racemase
MSEISTGPVQTAVRERVLEVTLSDPPDNRITIHVLRGLDEALDRFEEDAGLDLLLLQGSKTCFSKGFDLSALGSGATKLELRKSLVLSNALFSRLARCPKPTIAAINGACLGGGLELALACHFRLCSDRARLGLPEIWIKLVPGLGGADRLRRLIGDAKALEMVALGDLVTPEDALRVNLVNRVFPRAEFADRVNGFVKALLMAECHALQWAIRLIGSGGAYRAEENIGLGRDAFAELAWNWTPPQTT